MANSVSPKQMSIFSKFSFRLLGLFFFLFSMLIIFSETTLVFGAHDEVLAFSKVNFLYFIKNVIFLVFKIF